MKPNQVSSESVRGKTSVKPVQRRLLIPLAGVLLLLVGGFVVVLTIMQQHSLNQSSPQILKDVSNELAESPSEQSDAFMVNKGDPREVLDDE